MSTVVMHNVVSVDGFIADTDDQVGPLFDWYASGDTELVEGVTPRAADLTRILTGERRTTSSTM
jgi:hypothetical protein